MARPKNITVMSEETKRDLVFKIIQDMVDNGIGAERSIKNHKFSTRTFYEILAQYEDLQKAYARAREAFCDKIASEILEISDMDVPITPKGMTDHGAVAKQKLQIDTRRWLLSKLAPKQYGDRIAVAGDNESPLKVNMDVGLDATKLPTDVLQAIMSAKDNDSNQE